MGVYSARVGPSRGVSGYITTKSLSVGYNQFTVNSPQDLCQIIYKSCNYLQSLEAQLINFIQVNIIYLFQKMGVLLW